MSDDDYDDDFSLDRGDSSEYDDVEEKIDIFGAERNAFERVYSGRHDDLLSKLFPEGFGTKESKRLDAINRKLFYLTITPQEKFKLMLSIFFNTYNSTLKLGNDDLDILSSIDNKKNIEYKNPIGYLFGYYVTPDKKSINKQRLEKIKDLLMDISEVSLEDVIRYARYWIFENN